MLRYVLWSIDGTLWEGGVGGVEGCFPEVGELGEDVGDGVLGAGVEEGDQARVVGDELPEGGPGVRVGDFVAGEGGVGVLFDAAGGEGVCEVCDVGVVGVRQQDGDDFFGVRVEPGLDCFEVVLHAAGVFHGALGVAET